MISGPPGERAGDLVPAVPTAAGAAAVPSYGGCRGGAGPSTGLPGPASSPRSLAEIDLEASCQRMLLEIDYQHSEGLISSVETGRRRRAAYAWLAAASADLRAWEAATGC